MVAFRSLFTSAVAAAASSSFVQHTMPRLPEGWRRLNSDVSPDDLVTFRFALRREGLAELYRVARAVSDPSDASYGHHLSPKAARALASASDSAITAVERWLGEQGISFKRQHEIVEVSLDVAHAATLLRSNFHLVADNAGRRVIQADDFQLPTEVSQSIVATYGLHGLPLLAQPPMLIHDLGQNVTPSLIQSTYNVSGVTPSGSKANRQAVAEFQGQSMNATDLSNFFNEFVPAAPKSQGEIYKSLGDGALGGAGIEASLDVQYIMGVAPGVLTEFWYWADRDFCSDLKNWTATLLDTEDAPLVHSISYGYQGVLERAGCDKGIVDDIDVDFASIAARGMTLIFASGDVGSGYDACDSSGMRQDTAIIGTASPFAVPADDPSICCSLAKQRGWAFTFVPPPAFTADQCNAQDGMALEGDAHGTIYNFTEDLCCDVALGTPGLHGYVWQKNTTATDDSGTCIPFVNVTGMKADNSSKAAKTKSIIGTCVFYTEVVSLVHSPGNLSAGGSIVPPVPALYPSWPASSPWVTSVGATRFTEESSAATKEAASGAFGSGGGFSRMFSAPEEQLAAIQAYLSHAPQLPPNGSYPLNGRGTPDVAALGERYQVFVDGKLRSVGGTSASAPVFAGLVSLLNEARLQAGMSAMGFLNPWLYAHEHAFTDIVEGDNFIGRGDRLPFGFNCSAGWDPVTGLGTPVFDRMLDAAMTMASAATVV